MKLLDSDILELDGANGRTRIAYKGRADVYTAQGVILGSGFCAIMIDGIAIGASDHGNLQYIVLTLGMRASKIGYMQPRRLIAEGLGIVQ